MSRRPIRLSEEELEQVRQGLQFLECRDFPAAAAVLQRVVDVYQSYAEPTDAEKERWAAEGEAWFASLRVYDPKHPKIDCSRSGCGHSYGRHFDPFEGDREVGCKYCSCETFVEPPVEPVSDEEMAALIWWRANRMDQCMNYHPNECYSKTLSTLSDWIKPESVPEKLRKAIVAFKALGSKEQAEVVAKHLGYDPEFHSSFEY